MEKSDLKTYFANLIVQVEKSEISNAGKDKNGFYKPTRTIILRNLNLLKDLYNKPRAKSMVRAAWQAILEELPPEMLIMNSEQKKMFQEIFKPDH